KQILSPLGGVNANHLATVGATRQVEQRIVIPVGMKHREPVYDGVMFHRKEPVQRSAQRAVVVRDTRQVDAGTARVEQQQAVGSNLELGAVAQTLLLRGVSAVDLRHDPRLRLLVDGSGSPVKSKPGRVDSDTVDQRDIAIPAGAG